MSQRSIGVVGAGNMGSGIAQKIATEGLKVVMVDVDEKAVARGLERIRALLGEGVQRRIFTPEQAEAIAGRITPTTRFGDCRDCEIVIEAVFEDLKVKRNVFGQLDEACGPDTILATNTSSFYVQQVAESTRRPDRVVGMHYFYHPAKNRLVEVVGAKHTSPATLERSWSFNEVIGKTPIHSADAPGFVVNRYFVPWLNEAVRLLAENVADIATIEAASKKAFGIGMGPFELMNVTGVPISLHAATTLGHELGPFYEPADLLADQVEKGVAWDLSGEPDESRFQQVSDQLMGVVFQIAGTMVDEGVCTIEDADIGARVGLRWRRGPFELMNHFGITETRRRVEAVTELYADLRIPKVIDAQAKKGAPFPFALVKLEIEDGLAEITLNRPDALNALNEEVMTQLAAAFDAADARDDVRTIVLRGAGKAFVAGADIRFFVKNIEAKTLGRVQEFTQFAQDLLRRIDESDKLVICRLDGLSLGGGSELALCADAIVATEKGSLGFPETGIGIYPGLGGTQRTTRRVGLGLARYLVLTGDSVDAATALKMGLVDEVVGADRIGSRIREIHRSGQPPRSEPALNDRLRALQSFFAEADVEDLLAGRAQAPEPLAKVIQRVATKAPIACRLADRIIRTGVQEGIEAGLAMEVAHLPDVFATADAYEGLTALGKRRPQFAGR